MKYLSKVLDLVFVGLAVLTLSGSGWALGVLITVTWFQVFLNIVFAFGYRKATAVLPKWMTVVGSAADVATGLLVAAAGHPFLGFVWVMLAVNGVLLRSLVKGNLAKRGCAS